MTFRDGAATFERLTLWQKFFRFNWGLALLVLAVAAVGFLMLFSVAGGDVDPWASRQMTRFGVGFAIMIIVAMIDLRYWKLASPVMLNTYLGDEPAFKDVGGEQYLTTLARSVPSTVGAADYARVVFDLATSRGLIRLGTDMIEKARAADIDEDPQAQLASAEAEPSKAVSIRRLTRLFCVCCAGRAVR